MSEDVFVSIIVPIYNVEKYINICINSIISQTYRNYELILVDDGSPDKCPEICDGYAEQYCFIKAFHKKNGGLSDARNYGVKHASGEYVTFIDSDDYVSEDYLEVLVGMHEKYNADICVGGLCTFSEGEGTKLTVCHKESFFSGMEALKNMLYQNMLDTSACAMLLPIRVAKEHPFPVGKYHEDEFTTYQYYASVERVAVTSKTLYFYLQRKGSIMHVPGQASMDELDAADNLVAVCEGNWPELVKAAKSKKFSDYCQVLLTCPDMKSKDNKTYQKIITYLKNTKWVIINDKNTRIKNKIAAISLMFGARGLRFANYLRIKTME